MCLLIVKPAGHSIPFSHLENADRENPHGCGIAFADGCDVKISKGAKWGAQEIAAQLDKLTDCPALVHFRYATHGSQNNDNTHPFSLSKKWSAAHNGIISGMQCKKDESDTRAFLRNNVEPVLKAGGCLTDKRILSLFEQTVGAGNKLAFLHASGRYSIANEKSGHWNGGAWYSNHSYEKQEYSYAGEYFPDYHFYDTRELDCQWCGREIRGKFAAERDTGKLLCEDCLF